MSKLLKFLGISEFEKCISCGDLTKVKKNSHIDERLYYISGAGQLDKKCHEKIYGKKFNNQKYNEKTSLQNQIRDRLNYQ